MRPPAVLATEKREIAVRGSGGAGTRVDETATEEVLTELKAGLELPAGKHTIRIIHENMVDGRIDRFTVDNGTPAQDVSPRSTQSDDLSGKNMSAPAITHRQRFLRSLTGGSLDRFFRYEHGPWPTTRERWVGEGMSPQEGFGAFFGMDPLVRIMINSGYTASPYEPAFAREKIEETDTQVIYRGEDGVLKKELKSHADTSMPQFVKFPVADRADWREIVKRLDPGDARKRMGDVSHLQACCANPDLPTMLPICGAFGHPRNLLGDEGLSLLIYDDPALLEEILENWLELYVELLRELTSAVRVDALLIWEDMCFKNGPLISPAHVNTFMMPGYRKLIEKARAFGIKAILVDTDGDCLQLIPLFLDAGVDNLMPFEVQAGMDVVEIGKQYPGLSIMCGLDKRALAEDRSCDDIRREVDRVLPFFVDRGRYIPTLDHTVPPNVPLDRFKYYLECVRSYEP